MTATTAFGSADAAPPPTMRRDLLWAFLGSLALLAVNAWTGFETLTDLGGDNDSLLRLVQVRDLLDGQGWFDLTQYRMGPEGGFVMHWSRLVDAPIAGIMLAVSALSGNAGTGEMAALFLWPFLLAVASLFLILRTARAYGGEAAMLPALVIGCGALYFVTIFEPATLDHHNVQVVLTLAALAGVLDPARRSGAGLLAGISCALMMAVGMETLPCVAAIGLLVALLFIFGDAADRDVARGFGMGFGGAGAVAFVATVPPEGWGIVACDSYSIAHFAVAALAGAGMALAASVGPAHRTLPRRLLAMFLLGLLVSVLVGTAFPQCLTDPYASLDPRLKSHWLDLVREAQPLSKLLAQHPGIVVARYVTPLLGLVLAVSAAVGPARRRQDIVVAVLLATTLAVGAWQVRGTTLAIVLAVLPLSAWIGRARSVAATSASPRAAALMIFAWLASFNMTWAVGAAWVGASLDPKSEAETAEVSACTGETDLARLATLPRSTLLAVSNLGAPVLRYSPHRVLAGPYHRNVAGNLVALDAFLGPTDRAKALAVEHDVDFIVLCPGNTETTMFADANPDGLLAALIRGEVPAWLEPTGEGAALRLYRVRPD
ncbi:MAG: GtrA family protein [Mesorhizobium sp.]|nr:GtrA family protein [Mesorhizobium sp.]MCO5161103.1 GtrA family protein [Mesorhizobium sp.]